MTRQREDAAAIAWLMMVRRFGLTAIRPVDTDTGMMHGPSREYTHNPRPLL